MVVSASIYPPPSKDQYQQHIEQRVSSAPLALPCFVLEKRVSLFLKKISAAHLVLEAMPSSSSSSSSATSSSSSSRHLLRPPPRQQQQWEPYTVSDVVGLIPDAVHEALGVASGTSAAVAANAVVPTGHIDPHTGLACLVLPTAVNKNNASNSKTNNKIDVLHLWRHATQTLSEELRPSDNSWGTIVHPEHAECGTSGVGGALDGTRLVALVPYGSGGGGINMGGGMASPSAAGGRGGRAARTAAGGAARGKAAAASLYACTPAGSLAYWTDALSPASSSASTSTSTAGAAGGNLIESSTTANPCNAAVQLALDDGEVVTCLTSTSASLLPNVPNVGGLGGGGGGAAATITPASEPVILVGTSAGKLMMCTRLTRPLSLRARQLHRYAAPRLLLGNGGNGNGDDGSYGSAGASGGLLNMAYSAASYLMTPGKPKRGTGGGGAEEMAAASTSLQYFQGEGGSSSSSTGSTSSGIAQILALPPIVEPSSSSSAYLPTRPGSPSPTKTRRLSYPTNATGGDDSVAAAAAAAVRFLSLTDDLTLAQWRLDGRSDPTNPREGIEWEVNLNRMMTDRINAASSSSSSSGGGSQGYVAQIKALRASVSSDGRCAAVVFLAQLQSGEVRAYVASVNLAGASGSSAGSARRDEAISGPIWLNRHPSESLQSGRWTCGGMSVVPAAVAVGGSAGGGGSSGSYVLYSAWHDPLAGPDGTTEDGGSATAERGGAVTTAVLLPTTGGASSMTARLCDADLPPHVFPSLLSGMACPDLLSGGICLAGSTGCIADLRVVFPAPAAATTAFARGTRPLAPVDEAEVHTVASHILSTYLSHIATIAAEGDGASRHIAPGSVPPSIFAASPDVLGPAVLSALMKLLSLRSQQQGLHQSRQQRSQRDLFAPDGHADASATISFLNTHSFETLPSFVNFLIHAGIYLRVEARDRVKLRDVGEKMMATLALVDRWRDELAHAESSSPGNATIDEFTLTKVSSAINSMLGVGPVAVAERLPVLLADMQRDILGASSSSVLILDITSTLLCQAHTCALRYRADKTDDLFKLPLEDRNSVLSSCATWMSDGDLLKVYEVQLQQIKAVSSSSNPTSGGVRGEVHVQVLASALLDGYRDALNYASSEDKNVIVTSYHSAKVLSIPLLRLYDPSDMWPFDLSVDHGYFDGVFDVCHDWTVGCKRFEEEPDAEEKKEEGADQRSRSFDLKPILEACSAVASGESSDQGALYKDLMPPSVDPPSGLTFPQFVLKRYADLGLQGVLLDLGRLCPSDLETFVEEDKRMADHRWIVRVRSDKYGAGRDGLVDVVKDGSGGQSLSDRELTLSLAKLCNSIDAPSSGAIAAKGQAVDDGLTLLSVQRLLADGDQPDADRPMRPNELLSIVQTKVAAAVGGDAEESTRLCLAGLAVAEVAARGEQAEEMGRMPNIAAQYAAPIWSLAVLSDVHVWQSLAEEYAAGASGELGVRDDFEAAIESTVLFGVLQGYSEGRKNASSSIDVAIGYHDDSEIMAGLMNQLRAANAANEANAKALETVLLAAAGLV